MFLAAGEAAGRAAGSSWDALVKERIFTPLDMTRSVTTSIGLSDPNLAKPHGAVRDSVFVKPYLKIDNVAPAGSILSSVRDMAQWLRFQLADGTYQGKRLIEQAPFRETHRPQILMSGGGGGGGGAAAERTTFFNTYALGWMVHDYRGELVWEHGGNTDGMTSAVGMLPEQNLGVVVLTNMNGSALPGLLMRWVFDRQLNAPLRDLAGESLTRSRAQRVRADSAAGAQTPRRAAAGPPPVPLASFVGTYWDDVYGEATITLDRNVLMLRRGDWNGPLEFSSGTSFRWTVPFQPVGQPEFIRFDIASDDRVTGFYFGFGEFVWLMRKRGNAPGQGGSQ
jgi:CubicO group peptidase (beta-lactamase class C family)